MCKKSTARAHGGKSKQEKITVKNFKFESESEAWAAINALRQATDHYARQAREWQGKENGESLARQFSDQAALVAALADRIEATI